MGEIKIKVWDTKKKKFLLDTDFLVGSDGSVYDFTIDSDLNYNKSDRAIVVKYSGLKDKNGKEIYEGDILLFNASTGNIPKAYYMEPYTKGQIFIVKHMVSGFMLSIPECINSDIINIVGHVDNYTFWNHQRSFEIIGNIYENPELLEK